MGRMRGAEMFARLLGKLKSICQKGGCESDLTRDRNPRMLSPDVRRALKGLQRNCEEVGRDKADVK